jgi:hypothetical protein
VAVLFGKKRTETSHKKRESNPSKARQQQQTRTANLLPVL